MAIKINKETCIGCGTCAAVCAEAFELDDEGKAQVIKDEEADCVKEAVESCPVQAISTN